MRHRQNIFFFAIALGVSPQWLQAAVPPEVTEFTTRVERCLHWAGEEGDSDPERSAQITKAWQDLRCDSLRKDANRLERKYRAQDDAAEALDEASLQWKAGMGKPLLAEADESPLKP